MTWTRISKNKARQARSLEARLVKLLLSHRPCVRGCGTSWDDLLDGCWVHHQPGKRLAWICEPCAEELAGGREAADDSIPPYDQPCSGWL